MPGLRVLQEWLLAVSTHPESADQCIAGQSLPLTEVVRSNTLATPLERLEVYNHAYFARLEECLADDFPAVKHALGELAFANLCRHYATACPSRGPSLNNFGAQLPRFLEKRTTPRSFVSELARLEWAIVEVLHAPESDGLAAAALAALPSERNGEVRFAPGASVRLIQSEYPVNRYFQEYLQGAEPPLPSKQESFVVVARHGYRIRRFELPHEQGLVLARLFSGAPLGAALSGVEAEQGSVAAWFQGWTEQRFFTTATIAYET